MKKSISILIPIFFIIIIAAVLVSFRHEVSEKILSTFSRKIDNCILINKSSFTKNDSDLTQLRKLNVQLELINYCDRQINQVIIELKKNDSTEPPILIIDETIIFQKKLSENSINKTYILSETPPLSMNNYSFKVVSVD